MDRVAEDPAALLGDVRVLVVVVDVDTVGVVDDLRPLGRRRRAEHLLRERRVAVLERVAGGREVGAADVRIDVAGGGTGQEQLADATLADCRAGGRGVPIGLGVREDLAVGVGRVRAVGVEQLAGRRHLVLLQVARPTERAVTGAEEGDVEPIAALRPRRLAYRHDRRHERLGLAHDGVQGGAEGVGELVGRVGGVVGAAAVGGRALQEAVRDREPDRVRDDRLRAVHVGPQIGVEHHLGDVVEIVGAAVVVLAGLLVRRGSGDAAGGRGEVTGIGIATVAVLVVRRAEPGLDVVERPARIRAAVGIGEAGTAVAERDAVDLRPSVGHQDHVVALAEVLDGIGAGEIAVVLVVARGGDHAGRERRAGVGRQAVHDAGERRVVRAHHSFQNGLVVVVRGRLRRAGVVARQIVAVQDHQAEAYLVVGRILQQSVDDRFRDVHFRRIRQRLEVATIAGLHVRRRAVILSVDVGVGEDARAGMHLPCGLRRLARAVGVEGLATVVDRRRRRGAVVDVAVIVGDAVRHTAGVVEEDEDVRLHALTGDEDVEVAAGLDAERREERRHHECSDGSDRAFRLPMHGHTLSHCLLNSGRAVRPPFGGCWCRSGARCRGRRGRSRTR